LLDTTEPLRFSFTGARVDIWEDPGSASITPDGRYVAFTSSATNLVTDDTNGHPDIFVRDRQNGTTELISVSSSEVQGNYDSLNPSISADGRFVVFHTGATNLVPQDTAGIILRDRQNGTSELISLSTDGIPGNYGGDNPVITPDGRYIAFMSYSN